MAKQKRPSDVNLIAKQIVDEATKEPSPPSEPKPTKQKDPLAVELGRRGGLKGGKIRAERLTADEKTNIAKKAAEARWSKKKS